jgi:hypothetical protein
MNNNHICKCNTCGKDFDMRDLVEVVAHLHNDNAKVLEIKECKHGHITRFIGEPIEYVSGTQVQDLKFYVN